MDLKIKHRHAGQLARQLAKLTGENINEAVTIALRERLDRLRSQHKLAARLIRIGKDCARHLKEPSRSVLHADLLYDEQGLPH